MKIIFLLIVFSIVCNAAIFAQGFYFDIGFGVGGGWTSVDGHNVVSELERAGASVNSIGVELGFKAGYGPIAELPLFVVGTFGGFGHMIYDDENYIQFNSYMISPGVIFYPHRNIQLALDLGLSWGVNQTDIFGYEMFDTDGVGFAWALSAAVDLGGPRHGVLLGLKYIAAFNTLEVSRADISSSMFGIFVRYAHRHRIN